MTYIWIDSKRTWFILVLFTIGIYVPPLFGMGRILLSAQLLYGMSFVLGYIYGAWKGFDITIPLFEIIYFPTRRMHLLRFSMDVFSGCGDDNVIWGIGSAICGIVRAWMKRMM